MVYVHVLFVLWLGIVEMASPEYIVKNYGRIYKADPNVAMGIPCILPIADVNSAKITSGYGQRFHPVFKKSKHHSGIDIAVHGCGIVATANGRVANAGYNKALGNFILINHHNTYYSLYGHMSKLDKKINDPVAIGELIGQSGSTGISTGEHLHYAIYKGKQSLDPAMYMLLLYENL
jgi:murein DD-endopeptidase MepM/ murein hydrolase activator NlpD